jgi:hypothetical protein
VDEEVRSLSHALAGDPNDERAGSALARLLARREEKAPGGIEAVPLPAELVPGAVALVVRAARPRALFAWPAELDRAIGKTGRVLSVATDRLSCEVSIAGVGRFHAGAASLFAIPREGGAPPADESAPLASAELGALGWDGLTEAQRALLAAIPGDEPVALEGVVRQAGFVAENNRDVETAASVLDTLGKGRDEPLVEVFIPNLLGGQGTGAPTPWSRGELWAIKHRRADAIVAGLPWAVIAGVRTGDVVTPPHNARELGGALILLLKDPQADLDRVLRWFPGPDFGGGERGGSRSEIRGLYETGEGVLRVRPRFETRLPSTVIVTLPGPKEVRESFKDAIYAAFVASRLEGLGSTTAIDLTPEFLVNATRGYDVVALRRGLEALATEHELRYRLPLPLVPWLRAFLDEKRRQGANDDQVRAAIHAARPPAGSRSRLRP